MRNTKKALKLWWRDFKDVTPTEWKIVGGTCLSLAGALAAGWASMSVTGVSYPEEYGKYVGIAIGLLTAISVYAKSHTRQDGPSGE